MIPCITDIFLSPTAAINANEWKNLARIRPILRHHNRRPLVPRTSPSRTIIVLRQRNRNRIAVSKIHQDFCNSCCPGILTWAI